MLAVAAAAAPLAVGSFALGFASSIDINDGTVDVFVPSQPTELVSKAAAGKPMRTRAGT